MGDLDAIPVGTGIGYTGRAAVWIVGGPLAMVVLAIAEFILLGGGQGAQPSMNALLSPMLCIPAWIVFCGPVWALRGERPPGYRSMCLLMGAVLGTMSIYGQIAMAGNHLSFHGSRAFYSCSISALAILGTAWVRRGAQAGSGRSLLAWFFMAHAVGTLVGAFLDQAG